MNSTGFTADAGRQQFLQLLVTQIQHQDPLEPVKQEEFLQQLAQFSVVEGVQQLNVQFGDLLQFQALTQGAEIVGHEVSYRTDSGTAQGLVGSVTVQNGRLLLSIDGQSIPVDRVTSIHGSGATVS